MSVSEELQRLAGLRDQGVLTETEFEREKAKLLGADISKNPKEEKTDRLRLVNVVIALAIVVGILFVVNVVFDNKGSRRSSTTVSGIREIPDPVVLEWSGNDDKSSILDVIWSLKGRVKNKGAAGYVVIYGKVEQKGKTFKKHDRRWMEREEVVSISFDFEEVEAGEGGIRYNLWAE